MYARPLIAQIVFMKSCYHRGYVITVWSGNGKPWADEVVKKLKIGKYIKEVRTKFSFYVDDVEADKWMKRILIDGELTE